MSSWHTLSELISLPGLPSSMTGLRKKAEKEKWECRARSGRGGGWEYKLDSLPSVTQAILVAKGATTVVEEPMVRLTARVDQRRAWANLQIQQAFERFVSEYGDGMLRLLLELQFCELYNQRELISIASEVYEVFPTISRSKLCRDRKNLREQGVASLGTMSRRVGAIDLCPELQNAIEVCIAAGRGRWSPAQVRLALEKSFDSLPFLPTIHQLRRWLLKFATEQKHKLIQYRSDKETRNKLLPAFGNYSAALTVPNELWELDDTKQDLILEFEEDGQLREKRFALVGAIDVFTRRRKFQIYPTANTEAVLLLLRRCILDWGKPIRVKTDNGKNYVSERIDLFLRALEIEVDRCDPYQPQQKPHIERLFRTLQHGEFEMLPGYCGHSVAERQDIRDEKDVFRLRMTPEAFQGWLDHWCEGAHLKGSRGLDGRSPMEVLAQAIRQGWQARSIADERMLDFLILPVATRKVQKSGIQVNNRWYVAGELGRLVGQDVHVRWHPENPNDIFVYTDDSLENFVCIARWLTPMGAEQQQQVTALAKQEFKECQAEVKQKQKQAKTLKRLVEKDPLGLIKVSKEGNVSLNSPRQVPVTKLSDPMASVPTPQMAEVDQAEMLARKEKMQARLSRAASEPTEEQVFAADMKRARGLYERRSELSVEEREFLERWELINPNLARTIKSSVQRKALAERW